MDEDRRTDVALLRFSLIAPLVNGSLQTSVREYVEEVCAKTYEVAGVGRRQFAPRTVLDWRRLYLRHGLEGLKPKRRSDRGGFRRLSADAQAFLADALRKQPHRTATSLYEELAQARLLGHPPASLSTVQRFLRTVERPAAIEDRRRFAMSRANACWQSDVWVGPYLQDPQGRRRQRTHLLAILDDASRLCVQGLFSLAGNARAFERVFKAAVLQRGIPQRLYVDNAQIYHSRQLQILCGRLGIACSHTPPREPAGRGKIERFFRTVREMWADRLEPEELLSLEALNRSFHTFIEHVYHNRPHSSLEGKTPLQRFLADEEHLRFRSAEQIERDFLHEEDRRVAKDATVSLHRTVFEVPAAFIGHKVRIRFHPEDLQQAWIETPEGTLLAIRPVQPLDNAYIPRRQRTDPIDYRSLTEGEVL